MKTPNSLKNRLDIFYPLILCILVFLIALFNYFYFGSAVYDCGREFLVPSAVNQGGVLIKEIFITYFPLSYQINALVFRIFGESLDVLRVFGTIFLLVDVVLIYFCARYFTNEIKSFQIAIITCFIGMFGTFIFNYVLGYSYAYIYASGFFLAALNLYLRGNKYLILSFLLLGVCFALKSEYIFALIPFIFFAAKQGVRKIIFCIAAFFAPFILSFALLFIQGFDFTDFCNYLIFLKKFITTKSFLIYSKNAFYMDFKRWFLYQTKNFFIFAVIFSCLVCVMKLPLKTVKYPLGFILLFCWSIFNGRFCAQELFSYLCVLMLPLAYFSKNRAFVFVCLVVFLMGVRFNFIYTANYSAYIMPCALILFCVFFMEIIKNKRINSLFSGAMIIIGLVNIVYFSTANFILLQYRLETKKGTIALDKGDFNSISKILSAMDKMQGRVLILPEGHMLNFLSGKKTDLLLYNLPPNHIEALGEDYIVSRLRANPPENIIITNANYSIYNTPHFCEDFGKKICAFVFENYNYTQIAGNEPDFTFRIFKLKPVF